jgi:hypothetical protein
VPTEDRPELRDIRERLIRLSVEVEHLEEELDDLKKIVREMRDNTATELKGLKLDRVESRKWAVPVGISIITLLVLVISNTLTLVIR